MAYDREIVANALGNGDPATGLAYLEKIVQVAYPIPPLFQYQVRKFVDKKVNELLTMLGLNLRDYETDNYEIVNIKLDKCGGLTEGLALATEARRLGLGLMVGNMCGTSLAMAPAFLLAQQCRYVDLDGPLLQTEDRAHALEYRGGEITIGDAIRLTGSSRNTLKQYFRPWSSAVI